MKVSPLILAGVAVLAVVALSSSSGGATNSDFDLSVLNGTYDPSNVQRLQNAINGLGGQGLSDQQILFMACQMLQETGLFTDNPNYNATDNDNNFAGISSGGSLKQYNSLSDFANDYVRVLNLQPNVPIDATSIGDFNTRLKANGYYTDSATTYGNNLNAYYNILTSTVS